ncbi:jouberin-like [Convolutriloba macropyga]|uniref:jouberin-like n=1 Tax=Convolutriloba macropyga TaxID=536237 RepID=UPI003F52326F
MAPAKETVDVADSLRSSYQASLASKKKNNEDVELLESVKKGTTLQKEPDRIAESNLMSTSTDDKLSKGRPRSKKKQGVVNSGYDSADEKKPVKSGEKLEKIGDEDIIDESEAPIEAPKKKKRLKKKQNTEAVEQTQLQESEMHPEDKEELLSKDNEEAVPEETEAKPKRKKKKKKPAEDKTEREQPAVPRINFDSDDRILGITIHRTDRLKQHKFVSSPLVRVHVMDINTQDYVRKEDMKRELRLPHSQEFEGLEFHPPVCTEEFDFKQRQSLIPRWEQQLFLDERYLYFLENASEAGSPDILLLFEVLNYVDTTGGSGEGAGSSGGLRKGGGEGWMRIAWAFLKLVGANSTLNVEKKLRLQLFYPFKQFSNCPDDLTNDTTDGVEMMNWFVKMRRVKYPGTIYVTVKGTRVSAAAGQAVNKMIGRMTEAESDSHNDDGSRMSTGGEPVVWSRLPGQICKVPNKLNLSLKAGRNGCSVLRFSNDGRKLACACGDKSGGSYTIVIYDIPTGASLGKLPGHFSLIYDLCWSKTDSELISSSQDGFVLCWDIDRMSKDPVCVLNHPGYVYCAKYHPMTSHIVVSGCYDNVIRVWSTAVLASEKTGMLLQELSAHNGFVNCLCFNAQGTQMFSCDSVGTVVCWRVALSQDTLRGTTQLHSVSEENGEAASSTIVNGSKSDKHADQFVVERTFSDPEINGVPISVVQLHGSGKRLLLQCKDNTIRVLDLRLNLIMARYMGAVNFKDHIRSTFSPCGTYVFASSEDCTAIVWNTDTCETVCLYKDLGFTSSISDICYHPFEHLVAFCAIGTNQPVVLFSYDHKVPDRTYFDPSLAATVNMEQGAGGVVLEATGDHRGLQSTTTTPRLQHSFRAKAPMLNASAFYGPPKGASYGSGMGQTTPGRSDLMVKSSRELASEIIQSVRLDQVNRQLNASNISLELYSEQSTCETDANQKQQQQLLSESAAGGDIDTNRSGASLLPPGSSQRLESEQDVTQGGVESPSESAVNSARAPSLRAGDLVRQLDSEMPSARLSMLIQSEKPRFLISAKTGISQWARVVMDYSAERSDELTVKKGVLVKIVMKDNENWWLGQMQTESGSTAQGYVPSRCLEVVSESDAQAMTLLEEEENKARRSSKSGQTSTKPPMGGANDRHPQHSQEEVAESGPSEGSSGKRRTRKAKASRKAMSEGTETEDVAENIEMEPVDSKDKVMTEDSVQEIEELTEDLL